MAATQALAAAQAEERSARRAADEVGGPRASGWSRSSRPSRRPGCEAQARWEKAQDGPGRGGGGGRGASAAASRTSRPGSPRCARERDAKREALAQARLELAERRQKVEVLDRGLGEMERRREQLGELLVQRQQEIEAWTEQIGRAREGGGREQRRTRRAIGETLAVAQEQVETIRAELVAVEREIGALEAAQAALRQEADAAHEELSAHEVRLAEDAPAGAVFLAEEVAREFQADIAAVDWKAAALARRGRARGPEARSTSTRRRRREPRRAAARGRGARSSPARGASLARDLDADRTGTRSRPRSTRCASGSAPWAPSTWSRSRSTPSSSSATTSSGPRATTSTRAKAELIAAIDEINQTSQKQFEVTFEQIRKNFEYTFQTLFGGGRAAHRARPGRGRPRKRHRDRRPAARAPG